MQQYITSEAQGETEPDQPILTEEDEAFLQRVTSELANSESIPLDHASPQAVPALFPPVKDAQIALMDGAQNIPLPVSPSDELAEELVEDERNTRQQTNGGQNSTLADSGKKKKNRWSWMRLRSGMGEKKDKESSVAHERDGLKNVPGSDKEAPRQMDSEPRDEQQREEEDMTEILERLNLAAINNRVFTISDETQELLRKFKLIFKDLVNGVPTAYHDLEMLLTNGNTQLQKTYSQLPRFLQKMIEKLPERWTDTLAPEILAAASDRAEKSGLNLENVGKAAAVANKMGIQVPSLKDLVGKPAAILGMLRSIVTFLQARCPAVMGMNVLWSLALFLLLFVLWYCHKRGREVRLEHERLVTEAEAAQINERESEEQTLTTTAPRGASVDEIRQGIGDAEYARPSAAVDVISTEEYGPERQQENIPNEGDADVCLDVGTTLALRSSPRPWSKSRLSFWMKKPSIAPYPGT